MAARWAIFGNYLEPRPKPKMLPARLAGGCISNLFERFQFVRAMTMMIMVMTIIMIVMMTIMMMMVEMKIHMKANCNVGDH